MNFGFPDRWFTVFIAIVFGVLSGVLTAPSFARAQSSTENRTTVCSITANSSDEIRAFRSALGEKNYNYVELTKLPNAGPAAPGLNGASGNRWLGNACRQKIQCDILVLSGHFGGSFFGDSDIDLPVEELEQRSCDASCDGILQAPKEVYLFGCNTLAGKTHDARTPEQYRRALVEHGQTSEQAEQVVSFRYGPLGNSFSERMRRIFRGAKRIYGFDSIAPTGAQIKPYLIPYLKIAAKAGYYTPAKLRKLEAQPNRALQKALRSTALVQTSGAFDLKREQIPVCFLDDVSISTERKLKWIEKNLNSPEAFQYLPSINAFLGRAENAELTPADRALLDPVAKNATLRSRIETFIEKRNGAMVGMQLQLLGFMKYIGWIAPRAYIDRVEKTLIGDLSKDFSIERRNQICGYAQSKRVQVNLTFADIPAERWTDPEFISVVGCLGNSRPEIFWAITSIYLASNPHTAMYEAARVTLLGLEAPAANSAEYIARLIGPGDKPLTTHRRDYLCNALGTRPLLTLQNLPADQATSPDYVRDVGCFASPTVGVVQALRAISLKSQDAALRAAAIDSLQKWAQGSALDLQPAAASALAEIAATETNAPMRDTALEILAKARILPKPIVRELLARFETRLFEGGEEMLPKWVAVFTGLESRRLEICAWLPDVVTRLGQRERYSDIAGLADALARDCRVEIAKGAGSVLLRIFGEKKYGIEIADTTANTAALVATLVKTKVPVRTWRELLGFKTLNDLSVVNDQETVVPHAKLGTVVSRLPRLADETAADLSLVSGDAKRSLLSLLGTYDFDHVGIDSTLSRMATTANDLEVDSMLVWQALEKQRPDVAARQYFDNALQAKPLKVETIAHFQQPSLLVAPLWQRLNVAKADDAHKIRWIMRLGELHADQSGLQEELKKILKTGPSPSVRRALEKAVASLGVVEDETDSEDELN